VKNLSDIGETQNGQSRANPRDVAWLAGIIDGEGCVSMAKTGTGGRTFSPRLHIDNTSLKLMRKVQQVIADLGLKIPKISERRYQGKITFKLQVIRIPDLRVLLNEILQDLTVKKAQAEEMLFFCESRLNKPKYHEPFNEREKAVFQRLKDLKKEEFTYLVGGVETERKAPTES
jgi:LAGLIDADG-like domain